MSPRAEFKALPLAVRRTRAAVDTEGAVQTAGEFRLQSGLPSPLTHQCQNPDCPLPGKKFPHRRRGGQEFCSERCRSEIDEKARQALCRIPHHDAFVGYPAEKLFPSATALDFRPSAPAERCHQTWIELRALNRILSEVGPTNPLIRQEVRRRATDVAIAFELERSKTLEERSLFVGALEILRDVGLEANEDVRTLIRYSWSAVRFYRDIHDFPKLGRALLSCAMVNRLAQDERTARHMSRYAYHVLKEKCDVRDVNVARLLHQATFWDMRLSGPDADPKWADGQSKLLQRFASYVNTPLFGSKRDENLPGTGRFAKNTTRPQSS